MLKRRSTMKRLIGLASLQVLAFAVLLGVSVNCAMAEEEYGGRETKVSLDQVPVKVREAILKEVGQEGKLVDIGEIATGNGKVYEIELWIDGTEYDVLFDEKGKVLKREAEEGEDDEEGEEDGDEEEDGEEDEDDLDEGEKKVSIDQVPAKVREAILKAVGRGRLVDIGEMTRNGKTVYEIEMWLDGTEYDVLFDADGVVLKREAEENEDGDEEEAMWQDARKSLSKKRVKYADLPREVRTAILKTFVEAAGQARLVGVGQYKKNKQLFYMTGMLVRGKRFAILLDAKGAELCRKCEGPVFEGGGVERKVSINKVPAKVKAAILKAVGSGRLVDIGEITKGGQKFYEIEMWVGGVEYDVLFDAEGNVLKREADGEEDEGEEDEEDEDDDDDDEDEDEDDEDDDDDDEDDDDDDDDDDDEDGDF
jgi:hypothetical protein